MGSNILHDTNMSKHPFSDFTNLYPLSKTLRFELKPVGNTENMLMENNIVEIDKNRKLAYERTKPYFDKLHREFIQESLNNFEIDGLEEYLKTYKEYKTNKKDKKLFDKLKKARQELRSQVIASFNNTGKKWAEKRYTHLKLKKTDLNILFEEKVFQILKESYGDDQETKLINKDTGEIISIFDGWKGFTGYFKKFFATRENFYKSDGTSTALATRIIDHNLDRFIENILTFESQDVGSILEPHRELKIAANQLISIVYYNRCLTQEGLNTYNELIGGKTLENGEKVIGVNEVINEYRQNNRDKKISFLKKLDKQLLSEKEKFIDELDNENELFDMLLTFHESAKIRIKNLYKLLDKFFRSTEEYDIGGILISKEAFNTILHRWINDKSQLEEALYNTLKENAVEGINKVGETYRFPQFITLKDIKTALTAIGDENEIWKDRYYEKSGTSATQAGQPNWLQFVDIFKYEFDSLIVNKQRDQENQIDYSKSEPVFVKLLEEFRINKDTKKIIKDYLDSVLHIYQMAMYFALEKKRNWLTEYDSMLDTFYTEPDIGYLEFYANAYEEIVQPYNKVRNYLTRKPYSEEKWKLNFDNPTLADGWDKNKVASYSTVILRRNHEFFLGIMKKGYNKLFTKAKDTQEAEVEPNHYELLNYKFVKDVVTNIPKTTTQLKEVANHFQNSDDDYVLTKTSSIGDLLNPLKITKEIYEINNRIYLKEDLSRSVLRGEVNSDDEKYYIKVFQKEYLKLGGNETLHREAVKKWIDFCKQFLECYPSTAYFDYSLIKDSEKYDSVDEFYKELNQKGYKVWFTPFAESQIIESNSKGELYLFQIYNKDFSKESRGTKNLHTIYFEELFSQENLDNNYRFKLNGQAELFFRPKTDKDKLGERVDKKGNKRVINTRYSENKYFFHVPITLNRINKGVTRVNDLVCKLLASNDSINIIGVDRGEKHLAYYSVITQDGEVIESGSLNNLKGIDFKKLLSDRAVDRERDRKDWQEIQKIKDLKRGYVSLLVKKISDLAIKHGAIIVMEDLNMRFKQIRSGFEKSTYQQLEKGLIEKLNYLADKTHNNRSELGGIHKAYQLTSPFRSFDEIGKQTGIIFYTQAAYTSKIDPLTGWRPNLYLKNTNAKMAKIDLLNFDSIEYDDTKDHFKFTYDLKKFYPKAKEYPKKHIWTVCSNVERYKWDKKLNNNKGAYEHYDNITISIKEVLEEYEVDINKDLLKQIKDIDEEDKNNSKLFRSLIYYFGLICQIRNTKVDSDGDENDFILSPVEPFFDSRKAEVFGKHLPKNGDENGAYNIARKGVVMIRKVKRFMQVNGQSATPSWNDLYISNLEWDDFASRE
ncbi:MAG: type V CRISPR-associated protein Cas12a/Cpf1 [Candidatus Dojkabacteria bacterium]|nr:MAG: type V CRISPR-associated protein Cas12a/Cpf1 [Candidatus Dojkabacteria bacterium]